MAANSPTLCRAKTSGVARRVVASQAVAFAPFSQNSATCRAPSASGHAHDWQSYPSFWLIAVSVRRERRTPISDRACLNAVVTPRNPAAADDGLEISIFETSSSGDRWLFVIPSEVRDLPRILR